mmetsp:Transcript_33154/g.48609  ORF Transcript_33154/g.48609 Transcript_33154/m.48609 type:complete len:699 (-) Transcript_33154:233-2329(-)
MANRGHDQNRKHRRSDIRAAGYLLGLLAVTVLSTNTSTCSLVAAVSSVSSSLHNPHPGSSADSDIGRETAGHSTRIGPRTEPKASTHKQPGKQRPNDTSKTYDEAMSRREELGKFHNAFNKMRPEKLEKMSPVKARKALKQTKQDTSNLRRQAWFSSSSLSGPETSLFLADTSESYDAWQQAYRTLGAFIDCDHSWNYENSHDSGDNGDNDDGEDPVACSRWMMWASYIDPNYQGGGRDEYMGDDATGTLDCHEPNSDWVLLGVYRQEFYQYLEQLSKHLWKIDEYEYATVLAGLAYMTDDECFAVGNDDDGGAFYAGIQPLEGGHFMLSLYSDEQCINLSNTKYTFSDFGLESDIDFGSGDMDDDTNLGYAQEWWEAAQEYTLTNMNAVYDRFQVCTLCLDYPTYQDGFFIGDYGTDDDDLINQCWKFHSHDSHFCNGDCIALGSNQGTVLQFNYDSYSFGSGEPQYSNWYSSSGSSSSSGGDGEDERTGVSSAFPTWTVTPSTWDQFKANAYVFVASIMFLGTFLAFAVARGSARAAENDEKSHVLLDEYYRDPLDSKGRRRRASSRRRGDRSTRSRSSRRRKEGSSRDRDRDREKRRRERERRRRQESGSDREGGDYRAPSVRDSSRGAERSERRSGSSNRRSSSRPRRSGSSSRPRRSSSRPRTDDRERSSSRGGERARRSKSQSRRQRDRDDF